MTDSISLEKYAEEFRQKMGQLAIDKEDSSYNSFDYYRFNVDDIGYSSESVFAATTDFGAYYIFLGHAVSYGLRIYENLTGPLWNDPLYQIPITDQIVEDLISKELLHSSEGPPKLPDPIRYYPEETYRLEVYDDIQSNPEEFRLRSQIINLAMDDYEEDSDFRYYQFDFRFFYEAKEKLLGLPLSRSIFIAQSPIQALDLFLRTENNQPNYPFLREDYDEYGEGDYPYGEEEEYLQEHPDFSVYLTYGEILGEIQKSYPDRKDIELFVERLMTKTENDRGLRLKEVQAYYFKPQSEIKSASKI